jgi:hypothetical protein
MSEFDAIITRKSSAASSTRLGSIPLASCVSKVGSCHIHCYCSTVALSHPLLLQHYSALTSTVTAALWRSHIHCYCRTVALSYALLLQHCSGCGRVHTGGAENATNMGDVTASFRLTLLLVKPGPLVLRPFIGL